jgi:hypothetical protein
MNKPALAPFRLFRPGFFLGGVLLGLGLLSGLARWVSVRNYHEAFTRFHVRISPEGQYYPTINEMVG